MKPKIFTDIANLNLHTVNQGNPHKVDSLQTDLVARYNFYAYEKDTNGIFARVEFKTKTNVLFAKSVLTNPDTLGNYQTQTITIYESNGTTPKETITYSMAYDSDGSMISRVIL